MESLDWIRFTRVNRKVCNAKIVITPEPLPFPSSFELHYVYTMHHCISFVLRCLGAVIVRSWKDLKKAWTAAQDSDNVCLISLSWNSFLTVWMDHWTKTLSVKPEDAISNDMVSLVNLFHFYEDHVQFANDWQRWWINDINSNFI